MTVRRHPPGALAVALVPIALVSACDVEADPCVEVSAECAPLYPPVYDEIFSRTLRPTCGQPGSSCHAAQGANGGLVFDDPDAAHALLLGLTDGRVRVRPRDPSCSLLVRRIESSDPARVMPPGMPLDEPARCAIVQWIANGAKR